MPETTFKRETYLGKVSQVSDSLLSFLAARWQLAGSCRQPASSLPELPAGACYNAAARPRGR